MRLQQEPKGYDGDSKALKITSNVSVHILDGLKSLEANHPYLRNDYTEYAALRAEIEQARITPPEDQTVLGVLYDKIRECLHHISDERNAQVTSIGQARRLIPRNYLPISFDLLLEDFGERGVAENVRHGTSDIVEDAILGEIDIETINYTHRARVEGKVMKALVYDYGRAGEIRRELSELEERKVFRLLKLNDVQLQNVRRAIGVDPLPAKNPELPEPVMAAVSLIILRTRAQIIHEKVVPKMPPAEEVAPDLEHSDEDAAVTA
jgi:hypothetical protein